MTKPRPIVSAAERARRSERAKAQHRQGRFGVAAKRSKAQRETEQRELDAYRIEMMKAEGTAGIALELIAENRQQISETVTSIFKSGSKAEKLKLVDLLMKNGLLSARLGLEKQAVNSQFDRDQAIKILAQRLTSGVTATVLRKELAARSGEVIEAGEAINTRSPTSASRNPDRLTN